jgi:O-methyltransferase
MQTRPHFPPDFLGADIALCESVAAFTMTGAERVYALAEATRYIVRNQIPGAFVECGVWRGGSMMAVAKVLLEMGATDRELYLFDTFEGMTPPTEVDRDPKGNDAAAILARTKRVAEFSPVSPDPRRAPLWNMWCVAGEDDVRANMASTGYDMSRVHLVKGDVLETVPNAAPTEIALLRLDTDWYASTQHELTHLYPCLAASGVLIIDDYGAWQGARKAVDEYFATLPRPPLLHRIDQTARVGIVR